MSPEPPDPPAPDELPRAPAPPPGLFGAAWIRVALIVFVVAAVAAIIVAYALSRMGEQSTAAVIPPAPVKVAPAAPPAPAPPAAAPSSPPSTGKPPATAAGATSAPVPPAPAPTVPAPSPPPAAAPSKPALPPPPSAAKPPAPRAAATPPRPVATAGGGPYWVQVGAYKDEKRATEVAERLRAAGFNVEESVLRRGAGDRPAAPAAPAAPDRFDVFVSGATVADVKAKLEGKPVSASPVAGGAVVTPSLPRADAEAVARELGAAGWRTSVRRASDLAETGARPERSAPPRERVAAGEGPEEILHRVRVGGFPDRAAAEAARRALKDRGYASFVAREP